MNSIVDRVDEQPADETDAFAEPVVSVIIPHYNDLENLGQCLSLLRRQSMPRWQYEVIVADNNSSCGLAAVVTACKDAHVVTAKKQGAGEARNSGVSAAHGKFLAFTDSDCRPEQQWLEQGVRAMNGADFVGGRIRVSVDEQRRPTAAECYEIVFAFNNQRYVEEQGFSVTANMFTRREVFEKVGPFRVGVSEDRDWGQRARALGLQVRFAFDAVVAHPARREWSDLIRKTQRVTAETFLLTLERPYGRMIWFLRSWLILLSPVLHWRAILGCEELHGQRLKTIVALVCLRGWRFLEYNRILFREIVRTGKRRILSRLHSE